MNTYLSRSIRSLELVGLGEPVIQVARNLGISETCLRRWMAQDAIDTGHADGITSAEKQELVELRRKNRVLEMEVEILKRDSAYFARENVLPLRSSRLRIPCGEGLA